MGIKLDAESQQPTKLGALVVHGDYILNVSRKKEKKAVALALKQITLYLNTNSLIF
jgi:hypothetical protein